MPDDLRFTGRNPPSELWGQFPNWRNAYEEEGKESQDETTLMPHEIQTHVSASTSFTTGVARFNDGREYPVFIAIGRNGIDGCQVYETSVPWRIYYKYPEKRWVSFGAEWLPESERPPQVVFNDAHIFPLKIRMAVPWRIGDRPSIYVIGSDGQLRETVN